MVETINGTANVAAAGSAGDSRRVAYRQSRVAHWDAVAGALDRFDRWNRGYHDRLGELYRWAIPTGQRVLEIGCGAGDLLAGLRPSTGVGVDFSRRMLDVAEHRHPELRFVLADAHELDLGQTFDYIILSDVINDVWDVQQVFERVRRHSEPHTRILLNFHSHLWQLPLKAVRALGLSRPTLEQSWLTVDDVGNLLELADCEVVRHSTEVLWPARAAGLARLCNRVLAKMWPFNIAALTHLLVARPSPDRSQPAEPPRVSVVVPARNEAGNIPTIFERVPEMGAGTELIFVEGHSSDNTFAAIEAQVAARPNRNAILLRQRGEGKGDAVREGFARATGDVLMILDADLTVAPEDLPRFLAALVDGKGEMVNGVRLVYPMDDRAMRFFNLIGNKFFSLLFTWLLGQTIKDTLCGTKVLWRRDYQRITENRSYFGDFDPFGDFDLLFGAAKLNRKIVEMPVRYRERVYGETQIRRWRHGVMLLRMSIVAMRKLRFV